MNKPFHIQAMSLSLMVFSFSFLATSLLNAETLTLENKCLKRVLSTTDGVLRTQEIVNHRANKTAAPLACAEFRLRISQGTDKEGTDFHLSTEDFSYVKTLKQEGNHIAVELANAEHGLKVVVHYTLADDAFYMRKYLEVTSSKEICLERVDVDTLSFSDAYQPYQIKKITSQASGQWKPGLGQPLFTTESGTFWGIEFPAAVNFVNENQLHCGYLHGRMLKPDETYTTYRSVMGVSDDPEFNSDAFYDYITEIRVRPLRLQVQYNSWFDYAQGVHKTKFSKSVSEINEALCVQRGVTPLKAYVIDDGWQTIDNWTEAPAQVWKVNDRFDSDFKTSKAAVHAAKSKLGVWISPGCNFGARRAIPFMREKGWGALGANMSLSDTRYMDMLEERMVGLAADDVSYFKMDGLFGHLITREFDINGAAHGVPTMPQLGTKDLKGTSGRLNDSKYDELKTYYLTVGTQRLIEIYGAMAEANPDVYLVISNGAYLSPWWLMHVDSVWMINAGDAARGSNRTSELVYRDGVYHEIWAKEKTHFPMNAIFNHEPKKILNNETKEAFRKYLYMNMSRGTGFVELYVKVRVFQEYDWDVMAEALLWVEDVFPTFTRSRMHGGSPTDNEVYGFTAWDEKRGYISLHNPSDDPQKYSLTLDRKFGLIPGTKSYFVSSPMDDSLEGVDAQYNYGDTIEFTLKPQEIRILNFDPEKRDWSKLKALQTRTKDDYIATPEKK